MDIVPSGEVIDLLGLGEERGFGSTSIFELLLKSRSSGDKSHDRVTEDVVEQTKSSLTARQLLIESYAFKNLVQSLHDLTQNPKPLDSADIQELVDVYRSQSENLDEIGETLKHAETDFFRVSEPFEGFDIPRPMHWFLRKLVLYLIKVYIRNQVDRAKRVYPL